MNAGAQLAGYRIEELVGRGGMGEVYRATDARLDRPVALKVLADRLAEDEGFRERLLRESRLAASLDHPNVIPIYEAGEDDGPALHRDAVRPRGGPAGPAAPRGRARPRAGDARSSPRSPTRSTPRTGAASSTATSSRATSCSTASEGREHCYLADFGLTQSAADEGPADGQIMGTVDYVSPEQIRGDTARRPRRPVQPRLPDVRVPDGDPPVPASAPRSRRCSPTSRSRSRSASERGAGAAAARSTRCSRAAMAKDPGERFESCGELVEAARRGARAGARGAAGARLRRWLPAARRRRRGPRRGAGVGRSPAAAVARRGVGDRGPGPDRPLDESGRAPHGGPRLSRGSSCVHPGRGLDGRLPRPACSGAIDPGAAAPERITSNGEPRDLAALGDQVYVGADGR